MRQKPGKGSGARPGTSRGSGAGKPGFGAKKSGPGGKPPGKPGGRAGGAGKPGFGAGEGFAGKGRGKPADGEAKGLKSRGGPGFKGTGRKTVKTRLGQDNPAEARAFGAKGGRTGGERPGGAGVPARPKGRAGGEKAGGARSADAGERVRSAPRQAAQKGDARLKKPLRDRAEAQSAMNAAEAGHGLDLDLDLDLEGAGGAVAGRKGAEAAEAAETEIVWGRHAVLEALKGERHVNKVWLLRGLEDARLAGSVRRLAREKGAVLQEVERGKLNDLAPSTHQGVVASLAPVAYADFEDIVERAKGQKHPLVLVLDGIEDPHNLGALIRTAGAAGAHGVVIPRRRAVGLTGTVAKAAAGALEHVPVARVSNLAQAIESLKGAGFWVVGADQDAPKLAYEADLKVPLAIVVGAEGPGVSRLTAEKCDLMVRFPMEGAVPSLNASVAGALLLFEAVRQRNAV